MKARALALAAGSLLVLTAAACGGDESGDTGNGDTGDGVQAIVPKEPTSPVTIRFAGHVGREPHWQRMTKEFEKLHPNINVEFETIPFENVEQKLTTEIAGGTAPDVAFLDAGVLGNFATRGALVNLEGYLAGSKTIKGDDYVDAFRRMTLVDGDMYGLPYNGESTGLFYRTDLFQQAGIDGPPTTWEEFEETAAALTDPENRKYGTIVFATEAMYYWQPWLFQAGGGLLGDDNKEILFDDEPAKRAAEFYVGLTEYSPPDFLASNSYDGRTAFANGQVAMYVAGAWFAGVLDQEFPKIKGRWATAPLPEDEKCATTIAGDNLAILESSENKDAAWMFIEYVSQPENVANWTYRAEGSTLLPPRTDLLESPELIEKKPILKGFADAMECGIVTTFENDNWAEVDALINEKLGEAMYGEITASEALDQAAQEGQPRLDRGVN
jgi:ABC-type glycerol-3-phosphate transport system substrate-binding protein